MRKISVPIAAWMCAVIATTALAGNLPIDGRYGTVDGCGLLSKHDMAEIAAIGGTEEFPSVADIDGDVIVASPHYVVGPDWVCEPGTIDGEYAALICVSFGATWVPMPIARFRAGRGTLRFEMDDEPTVILNRCG